MAQKRDKSKPKILTLSDPKFLDYLVKTFPKEIVPDETDFDFEAWEAMEAEQAAKYQLAQARRLLRLFEEWKAKSHGTKPQVTAKTRRFPEFRLGFVRWL